MPPALTLTRPVPTVPSRPRAAAATVAAPLSSPLAPLLTGCSTTPEWVMARRTAIGASFVVADEIRKVGVRAWLDAQFRPDTISEPFIATARAKYPAVWNTTPAADVTAGYSGISEGHMAEQLMRVHVLRPVYTKRHLQTSMADFWLDYFSLPYSENKMTGSARQLDALARTMAFRRFDDLLVAFIFSTGMLTYLDQYTSTRTHPTENLAREVMELYSVGVGRYTEADVKAASKLFSGLWGGTRPDGSVAIGVHETNHWFGAVTIRGRRYPNTAWNGGTTSGPKDIVRFVRDLANDPVTRANVCTRLARRFVSDTPPAPMVSAMQAAWVATGGSIEHVLRAMFTHPTWLTSAGRKWRRPAEVWASVAATAGVEWTHTRPASDLTEKPIATTYDAIRAAGQPVRDWPTPQGMPDRDAHWMGTASVLGGLNAADAVLGNTDPHLTCRGALAGRLGVTSTMTFVEAAVRILERVTGYRVPATHVLVDVLVTRLNGGTPPKSVNARMGTTAGVDRAVHAAMTSPLMFLR
ncbi:DUF1800 domain-containing protein [Phycicoccus sp. HDW14]|uniref:DUF1800 family protein n=1 Tax=Phycicoccus sp. HDW14 TaxID=2714941 RepID=UPI001408D703|nr:DUF1800 family protein [Phycicoccus sp. HDW14]QIM22764.1 DUF1800 domain-containing protein [Phycicoccus sp. HDW14]